MNQSTAAISGSRRQIVHRTRGVRHGAITRLMSPSDLGHVLKPFVFLDLFDTEESSLSGMGLHPHSGIATLSYMIEGSVRYEDTSGATGILAEGGVEWFKAGHGAWHGGGPNGSGRARGFQLWIALPPEQELGSAASHPYELALGNYSVHTGPATLRAGERRIAKIQARLQKQGRL